jgi:hypothetical protein
MSGVSLPVCHGSRGGIIKRRMAQWFITKNILTYLTLTDQPSTTITTT